MKEYTETITSYDCGIIAIKRVTVGGISPPIHNRESLASEKRRSNWEYCKSYFKNRCAYCLRSSVKLTRDHFIPKSKGGKNIARNIVAACEKCNKEKADYHPKDWCDKRQISRVKRYLNTIYWQ
jgi:5-methylcytosine-specific restriction endonuclease McrA